MAWWRAARAARPWEKAELVVILVFAISRLIYRTVFGVRFDASPASYFIQYLDPWFVAHAFWQSVLYLHHQAPLQILVVQGTIRLLGTARATVVLECGYLALGLALAIMLMRVLRRLGAPPLLATVAVSLYTAAPTTVLYENWLFYPLPTAALLAFSWLALLGYCRRGTFAAGLLFFSALGTVALLRATYGSVFLCATIGILLLWPPRTPARSSRRIVVQAAALPLLVVMLNAAKPAWLTGHTYGSALLWQNICVKIFGRLPRAERAHLVDAGLVSNAANYRGVTADPSAYGRFAVPHPPTGVPLLDFDRAPGGGHNSHALEHVLVGEAHYRPDALYLLRHYPAVYVESVWDALSTQYVSSPANVDCLDVERNFERLAPVRALADAAFVPVGQKRFLALILGLPLALFYAVYRLIGGRAAAESERTTRTAVAFALLTIGYSSAATLLISFGDFSRYRYEIDPLYLVLLVLLVADVARGATRRFRRGIARPPSMTSPRLVSADSIAAQSRTEQSKAVPS
jgi:hypothetical protein